MIDFEKWDKIVDDFGIYCGKKKVRVTCTDGNVYEEMCDGYGEEEDSNGDNGWAVWTVNRIFTREMVEKIEFLD